MMLNGLPPSFENFRCLIESRDTLPKSGDLKIKILNETLSRTNHMQEVDNKAFLTNSKSYINTQRAGSSSKYKNHGKCFRCGKFGHFAKNCRKVAAIGHHEHLQTLRRIFTYRRRPEKRLTKYKDS